MEQEGVKFVCNVEVGKNGDMKSFIDQHDAVVAAGGSTIPRNLNIPGRDLKGIHFAMDFLKQQNKTVGNISFKGERLIATDKDVVVIGGGDTGSDCVGTSNRQHANTVKQFELMVQPPEVRTDNMPWPTYPMILKTTSSHEEGCERFWGINTKSFLGNENGELRAILVSDVSWELDSLGRPVKFNEVGGSEREIPCQLVLLAMGFLHPQFQGLIENVGLELDVRGNVKAEEGLYQTNVSKVFTAGDMRRGQSLVVWAISEGREAARKVDEFLMGATTLPSKDRINEYVTS
jgi:glutamate synthase (NADPH/NADH) small chain